jgi:hypothetical protein
MAINDLVSIHEILWIEPNVTDQEGKIGKC